MIAEIHKEFPDMKTDVIREVADDDYVFSLMHFTGPAMVRWECQRDHTICMPCR
jgi:hypothetical protein